MSMSVMRFLRQLNAYGSINDNICSTYGSINVYAFPAGIINYIFDKVISKSYKI